MDRYDEFTRWQESPMWMIRDVMIISAIWYFAGPVWVAVAIGIALFLNRLCNGGPNNVVGDIGPDALTGNWIVGHKHRRP